MGRHRWFEVNWPISISHIASRMQNLAFDLKSNNGFILDRVRRDYIEAKFVQKMVVDETTLDPFGNQVEFSRTEFRQWHFRAQQSGPGLEIIDAPRSNHQFLSKISEVCDFSISVREASVDLMLWYEKIMQNKEISAIVDLLQFSQIDLQNGISLRTTIKSKKDLIDDMKLKFATGTTRVEKMRLRLDGRYRGFLVIGDNLSLVLDATYEDELASMVRKTIPDLQIDSSR